MNNEVRKPPREIYIEERDLDLICSSKMERGPGGYLFPQMFSLRVTKVQTHESVCMREILPGDDSLRVSRKDWDAIRMMADNDYGGSILERMERIEREQDIK